MTTSDRRLSVEIWSDVICPWCWIGLNRFRKASSAFPHADKIEITHHAFRLAAGTRPALIDDALPRKMGIPHSQVPSVLKQVEDVARAEGLAYRLSGSWTGDTTEAHVLIKHAIARGKGHDMLERLFRACLSEQVNVFERATLLTLAAEVGLGRAEAAATLNDAGLHAQVDADQRSLERLGCRGVPYFLIAGKLAVSGAQGHEAFADALSRGWDSLANSPDSQGSSNMCTPAGCAIR